MQTYMPYPATPQQVEQDEKVGAVRSVHRSDGGCPALPLWC